MSFAENTYVLQVIQAKDLLRNLNAMLKT